MEREPVGQRAGDPLRARRAAASSYAPWRSASAATVCSTASVSRVVRASARSSAPCVRVSDRPAPATRGEGRLRRRVLGDPRGDGPERRDERVELRAPRGPASRASAPSCACAPSTSFDAVATDASAACAARPSGSASCPLTDSSCAANTVTRRSMRVSASRARAVSRASARASASPTAVTARSSATASLAARASPASSRASPSAACVAPHPGPLPPPPRPGCRATPRPGRPRVARARRPWRAKGRRRAPGEIAGPRPSPAPSAPPGARRRVRSSPARPRRAVRPSLRARRPPPPPPSPTVSVRSGWAAAVTASAARAMPLSRSARIVPWRPRGSPRRRLRRRAAAPPGAPRRTARCASAIWADRRSKRRFDCARATTADGSASPLVASAVSAVSWRPARVSGRQRRSWRSG